jgi:hypothetical protein
LDRAATHVIDLLLSVEPDNMQAQSLRTLIEQSVTRDGYIGESFLVRHHVTC